MKQQLSMWVDVYRSDDGEMFVGIECDDPEVTFDGHYVCIFPRHENENDLEGAMERAEFMLSYMKGQRQIKR
jgi:DNA gyrase inhibitor GyrI